jgi:MFS family permease
VCLPLFSPDMNSSSPQFCIRTSGPPVRLHLHSYRSDLRNLGLLWRAAGDRHGRVVILDACLAIITVLVFANLLIVGIKSFVVIRTIMSVVAGLMAGAAAALVRDMSPRLTCALAFGLLTIGPVGSNYLANFIAGLTLPLYHTWQSQMWIMGFIATVMYLPIFLWLKDLSPELRLKIFQSELANLGEGGRRRPTAAELPSCEPNICRNPRPAEIGPS